MTKRLIDVDTILNQAKPLTHQHAHEIQPFGHLVKLPIALAEKVCRDSVDNLNQLLADKHPDKRERLVKRLLADNRRYAEHWLSFWNDALRNDYRGTGYIDGGRKQITAWLYSALANNMPFDEFVRELIDQVLGHFDFAVVDLDVVGHA